MTTHCVLCMACRGYIASEYLAHAPKRLMSIALGFFYSKSYVSGVWNNKFQPDNPLQTLVTDVSSKRTFYTVCYSFYSNNKNYKIIDKSLEIEDIEEMKRVVQVGPLCTQESPDLRPTMTSVIQMLRRRGLALPAPSIKAPFPL